MNDDELLSRLAMALLDPGAPSEPPSASLSAFRAMVASAGGGPGVGRVVTPMAAARRRSWRGPGAAPWGRRAVAAGAAVAVAAGGSGVAVAAGGAPLPRPFREMATFVGLPVDGVNVADARSARDALARALRRGDRAAVQSDAERLNRALAALSARERSKLGTGPSHLLDDARAFTGTTPGTRNPVPVTSTTSSSTSTTSTTSGGTTTTTTEPPTGSSAPTSVPTAPPEAGGGSTTAPAGQPRSSTTTRPSPTPTSAPPSTARPPTTGPPNRSSAPPKTTPGDGPGNGTTKEGSADTSAPTALVGASPVAVPRPPVPVLPTLPSVPGGLPPVPVP